MSNLMLFTGNSNPDLAKKVAAHLGLPLGDVTVGAFSDGEVMVQVNENVRGMDVFIIQSTCSPANDNLMELMLLADAMRRASAATITAVIPYFGYSRQDRRVHSARVPISAKVVADMLSGVGITRILTVDLHADQIQGFFNIPVDNAYGSSILLEEIRTSPTDRITVVSPDVGGVVRARACAKQLPNSELAIIDKRRVKPNEAQVMNIIGDIKGKNCVLIDDMVDTAGTLCKAADVLKDRGASAVSAFCTHPILSGAAIERIEASSLDSLVVTDTIPLPDRALASGKIRQLSLAGMLSEAIRRLSESESISSMFPI